MSDDWQRLSVRQGRRAFPELSEGFSPAATQTLAYWLEGQFGYRSTGSRDRDEQLVRAVALACDIELNPHNTYNVSLMQQLIGEAEEDDDLMLDVLDATLARSFRHDENSLIETLRDAHSVWTVRSDGRALVRRVDATAANAFSNASSPQDAASAELKEAWSALYGTTPDYSDAWDHSIKAMEEVLIPIVTPNNTKATLGTVIAEVAKSPGWLSFDLGDAAALESTLRLTWVNPDRHGGNNKRAPEQAETAAVVHLAVTVVQWCRDGVIWRSEA